MLVGGNLTFEKSPLLYFYPSSRTTKGRAMRSKNGIRPGQQLASMPVPTSTCGAPDHATSPQSRRSLRQCYFQRTPTSTLSASLAAAT
ncbi:hypothetical protein CONPUDRAFT_156974 [Coniophora puteana RWD-64-598 SS2]|uniref:Uncharacterized protein n=1 Tax=Coniophora puteana (strain RWD-64-598) TaxID=741705 RepID=A0A5M3MFU3_CONPW|nr:uncharacterized protein CONPUDRAFT_156974 [Coniophora puteana RWD-64-598 SS2]EIW77790.1 hypothetical protein CONPUDRAFT_156974 [Coniophora puteana RWD-64-598 SS2]